jgi:hypothetical protein
MLSGLDAVEWHALSHAYGVAVDVPDQLRAVAGGDHSSAEQALYELYGSLWNEGTVYSATAAALPFLVELATAGSLETSLRVDVAVLLARIGAASRGDSGDRRRASEALEQSRASLAGLLDAEQPDIRVAAAGLAAIFPTPARAWVSRLRQLRDSEGDPLVRAHFSIAAALADGRQPDRRDVDQAAGLDPYVARWRGSRFEGLLGLRVSRSAAMDLSLMLTELALERV